MPGSSHYIRILNVPPGEAPLWVRQKWVGLELPLTYGDRGRSEAYTSGVLSGPRNRVIALLWRLLGKLDRKSGYAVNAHDALSILEQTAPEAATWWRQNVPRVLARDRKFLFDPSVCELA